MPRARTAPKTFPRTVSHASLPATVLKTRSGAPVPLRGVAATGRLDGLLFELSVEQRYCNDGNRNLEAVFTFPLPLRAVLLGFELEIGERRLKAHAVARAEASEKYERAIDSGDTAALVEHDGNGLYTVSLGNLGAGETAVIRYRYAELLDAHHGYVRLNVPTVIAPRYGDPRDAGLEGPAVPGVDVLGEYPFEISLDLVHVTNAIGLRSPSHEIVTTVRENGLTVRLTRQGFLDRDFVLEIDQAAIPPHALLARDGDGYVCVASPVLGIDTNEQRPLALKILLDCSGSMGGDSITAAKRALLALLDHLTANDRISLTRFGSSIDQVTEGLEPADEHSLTPLKTVVRQIDADLGGTEMESALEAALSLSAPADRQPDVILITDGEIYDVEGVVKLAARSHHRLFAIAIGAAPNEALARSLAEQTGGGCEFLGPNDDAEAAILRTFKRLRSTPRTLGQVQWPTQPDWTAPQPSAVFPGDTLHLIAGFSALPSGSLELTISATGEAATVLHVPVATQLTDGDLLPRLAAARRLVALDEDTARDLAVRYQLATAYTSFVVVAERADADKATDLPATVAVPHMLAAGWGGSANTRWSAASVRLAMDASDELCGEQEGRGSVESACWASLTELGDWRTPPALSTPPTASVVPEDVVARLLGRPDLPCSFAELAAFGVPDELIRELQRFCADAGLSESTVVESFLAELVDRSSRRTPATLESRELHDRLAHVFTDRQLRGLRRELRQIVDRFEQRP